MASNNNQSGLKGLVNRGVSLADVIPGSLIAVMARLSMAAVFWKSGQTKVNGFEVTEQAIFLFEYEYDLPLISPALAAHLAAFSEHFFPVLLILGLATRFGAAALLVMTLVIQFLVYPQAWVVHLTWATALTYLIARGPGVLSFDHFIKKKME